MHQVDAPEMRQVIDSREVKTSPKLIFIEFSQPAQIGDIYLSKSVVRCGAWGKVCKLLVVFDSPFLFFPPLIAFL